MKQYNKNAEQIALDNGFNSIEEAEQALAEVLKSEEKTVNLCQEPAEDEEFETKRQVSCTPDLKLYQAQKIINDYHKQIQQLRLEVKRLGG